VPLTKQPFLGPGHWRNCDGDLSGPEFVTLWSGLEKVRRDIRIRKGERTEFVKVICLTMKLTNMNAPSRARSDGGSPPLTSEPSPAFWYSHSLIPSVPFRSSYRIKILCEPSLTSRNASGANARVADVRPQNAEEGAHTMAVRSLWSAQQTENC
jgi:hypothetical protein